MHEIIERAAAARAGGSRRPRFAGRLRPLLRHGLVAAVAIISALAVAGCAANAASPTGVATLRSPNASSSPAASDDPAARYEALLKYSQCMRSHGITNFPDPVNNNGNVGMIIQGGPNASNGFDPQSPQYTAAQQACQSLMPPPPPNAGHDTQAQQQKMLAFSACMRAHGMPDFPDPQFSDGRVNMNVPSSIDASSPAFQAAQQACQSILGGAAPAPNASAMASPGVSK